MDNTGATARLVSRRSMAAGLFGGVVAWVIGAFGRVPVAQAGNDGDVVLGAPNSEISPTSITNPGKGGTAFAANTSGGLATSIQATATGTDSVGVQAESTGTGGIAIRATGGGDGSGIGVRAEAGGTGVAGRSSLDVGVEGFSGAGTGVVAESKTFKGLALQVLGKVAFSATSGTAIVPPGRRSITLVVPI